MSQSRIAELAEIIAANTSIVDKYFSDHDIPTPSFGLDAPLHINIAPHEKEVAKARYAVLDATMELNQLLTGHAALIWQSSPNDPISLGAIYYFNLPSTFPVGEHSTYEAISQKCGLNPHDLRRIMGHAMTMGIFEEDRSTGRVRHTATSKMLAEDSQAFDILGYRVVELYPAISRTLEALRRWGHPETPQQSGYALANGGKAFFEVMSMDETRQKRFATFMSAITRSVPDMTKSLVEQFDWRAFGKATMVDIGGGIGLVSVALAQAFPDLKITVQDFQGTIDEGIRHLPDDLRDRVRFMAHDATQSQPMKGADIYFERNVLHDYPDAMCVKIIRNLVPALKKGASVIINEPSPSRSVTMSKTMQKFWINMDLRMLSLYGARERDPKDFEMLFRDADPRFELKSTTLLSSGMHAIHFVWTGEEGE